MTVNPATGPAPAGTGIRLHAPAPGWAVEADVVVVGSGVAGLTVALRCAAAGAKVTVVTKAHLDDGSTRWAQGGIAAALGDGDTPEQHLDDTLVAGVGLCDEGAVRLLVTEGPDALRRLIAAGARFDTDAESGEILLTREGGHHRRRIAHAGGDATGAEVSRALIAAVRDAGIEFVENALALDLLTDAEGRTAGVTLHVMGAGARDGVGAVHAPAVVLATGGMGQVYAATTNPPVSTGDGVALALRAGAEVSDLEFVQFHPTVLWLGPDAEGQQPLVSEAVRGEGAHLVDADGVRFMVGRHELAELAPRDVVAKGILNRMLETGASHMYLDARHFGAAMWEQRFPTILAACRAHGIDPVTRPIPVAPAAHYASGGIRTDHHGRTTVPGLFACGEAACTGVHGANRLASNSLLEGLVFAERIATTLTAASTWGTPTGGTDGDAGGDVTHLRGTDAEAAAAALSGARGTARPAQARAADDPAPEGAPPSVAATDVAPSSAPAPHSASEWPLLAPEARFEVQRIMSAGAGVLRSAQSLTAAAGALERLHTAAVEAYDRDGKTAEACVETWEATNLALVARVLVAAARRREETRGSHWREDRPDRDDAAWRRHLVVRLTPHRTLDIRTTGGPDFDATRPPRIGDDGPARPTPGTAAAATTPHATEEFS